MVKRRKSAVNIKGIVDIGLAAIIAMVMMVAAVLFENKSDSSPFLGNGTAKPCSTSDRTDKKSGP